MLEAGVLLFHVTDALPEVDWSLFEGFVSLS
jgi:hypothetical protein